MTTGSDIIIIGAGIAGASVAAELADGRSVVLLEMESAAGYHTTGRSSATCVPTYGPPVIRALTRASEPFFRNPPEGFSEHELISPRGELMLAGPGDEALIAQALEDGLEEISLAQAKQMLAPLKPENFVAAAYEAGAEDLDVDAMLQGFLRRAKAGGCVMKLNAEVQSMKRSGNGWEVETAAGTFAAPIVINAAGAWADNVATLAGVAPLGIQPKRRSAALVPIPDDWDVLAWPLTFGAGETFYFRPMSGKLMVSPADATPVEPHDAWADDMLIAEAIEHLQNTIDIEVTRLVHTWGGLRSFAPDGDPVIGFDPQAEGFFWLVGQGGYGIQTCPAMARCAAALAAGEDIPQDIAAEVVTAKALSPARLAPHNC